MHVGARYYEPAVGRWITADKYLGNLYQPLSLNRYLCCEDDPVNGVDPSGYFSIEEGIVGLYAGLAVAPRTPWGLVVGGFLGFIGGGYEEGDAEKFGYWLLRQVIRVGKAIQPFTGPVVDLLLPEEDVVLPRPWEPPYLQLPDPVKDFTWPPSFTVDGFNLR